jgi:preprotein translocase subunit SecE
VLTGVRRYLNESWAELKKVTWPTRETVIRLTLLVIAVSIAVGAYIAVLDRIFNTLLDAVLQ